MTTTPQSQEEIKQCYYAMINCLCEELDSYQKWEIWKFIETQIAQARREWAEEMKKKCLREFTNGHNCSFEEVYNSISSL